MKFNISEKYILNLYGEKIHAYYSGKVECCNKCDCCGKHLENAHEFLFYDDNIVERTKDNFSNIYMIGLSCVKKCVEV